MRGFFHYFAFSILILALHLSVGQEAYAGLKRDSHGDEEKKGGATPNVELDPKAPAKPAFPGCVPHIVKTSLQKLAPADATTGNTDRSDKLNAAVSAIAIATEKGMPDAVKAALTEAKAAGIPSAVFLGLLASPEMGLDRGRVKQLAELMSAEKDTDFEAIFATLPKIANVDARKVASMKRLFAGATTGEGIRKFLQSFVEHKLPLGIALMMVHAKEDVTKQGLKELDSTVFDEVSEERLAQRLAEVLPGTNFDKNPAKKFLRDLNNFRMASMTGNLTVAGVVPSLVDFAGQAKVAYVLPHLIGMELKGDKPVSEPFCLVNGDTATKKREALNASLDLRNIKEIERVSDSELNLRPYNLRDPKLLQSLATIQKPDSTQEEVETAVRELMKALSHEGVVPPLPILNDFVARLKGMKLTGDSKTKFQTALKKIAQNDFPNPVGKIDDAATRTAISNSLTKLGKMPLEEVPAEIERMMQAAKNSEVPNLQQDLAKHLRSGAVSLDMKRYRELMKAAALSSMPKNTKKGLEGLELDTLATLDEAGAARVVNELKAHQKKALRHLLNNGYFGVEATENLELALSARTGEEELSEKELNDTTAAISRNVRPSTRKQETTASRLAPIQRDLLGLSDKIGLMAIRDVMESLPEKNHPEVDKRLAKRFSGRLAEHKVKVKKDQLKPLAGHLSSFMSAPAEELTERAAELAQFVKENKISQKALTKMLQSREFGVSKPRMDAFATAMEASHAEDKPSEAEPETTRPDAPTPPAKPSDTVMTQFGRCIACHKDTAPFEGETDAQKLQNAATRLAARDKSKDFKTNLDDMLKMAKFKPDEATELREYLTGLHAAGTTTPPAPPTKEAPKDLDEAFSELHLEIPPGVKGLKDASAFDTAVAKDATLPDAVWAELAKVTDAAKKETPAYKILWNLVSNVANFEGGPNKYATRSPWSDQPPQRIIARYPTEAERTQHGGGGGRVLEKGHKYLFYQTLGTDGRPNGGLEPVPSKQKNSDRFIIYYSQNLGIKETDGTNRPYVFHENVLREIFQDATTKKWYWVEKKQ